MLSYPPAVSDIKPFKSLLEVSNYKRFEKNILNKTKKSKLIHGDSWVLLLSNLLESLSSKYNRNEVILPAHSCYEFTKAILLASLKPIYHDVDENFDVNCKVLEEYVSENTLAYIAVRNIGLDSYQKEIIDFCRERNIQHIEDSTYTILGYSKKNKKNFGSLSDYSVLNFSEGKIIPVGGGALLFSNQVDESILNKINKNLINESSKKQSFKDFFKLIIYSISTNTMIFSFYRIFYSCTKIDVKKILSMEKTRRSNSYDKTIKKLSRIKLSVSSLITSNVGNNLEARYKKYEYVFK